jgi:hypothetical protein
MVRVPGVAKLWLYLKMQKYIVYQFDEMGHRKIGKLQFE